MAKLVFENRHPQYMSHDAIRVCAQNIDTLLSSTINTIQRTYVIISRKRKDSLIPLTTFTSQLQNETWNDNLRYAQITLEWHSFQANPTAKNVCGLEIVSNKGTHLNWMSRWLKSICVNVYGIIFEHSIEENRPWLLKTALAPSLMNIGEIRGFKKVLTKFAFFNHVTRNKHNICNLAYIS